MMRALLAVLCLWPLLSLDMLAQAPAAKSPPAGPVRRLPNGTPDLNGFFQSDAGGANYGLGPHPRLNSRRRAAA